MGNSSAANVFRLGYFLPFAVPSVVAALIWGYFYGQSFGPIAQIATALHLKPPLFLTPTGIIPSIANIATWQYTGYNMLILFAALKGIPEELYERRVWMAPATCSIALKIRIPIIMPAIALTAIFSVIGTLQLFNEPNVMRTVAPTVLDSHFTPNIYVYNLAFANRQFDYSGRDSLYPGARHRRALIPCFAGCLPPGAIMTTQTRSHIRLNGSRSYSTTSKFSTYVFLFVCLGYFILPLFWLLISSTKTNAGLFNSFGFWFAKDFGLAQNLKDLFTYQDAAFIGWMKNTAIYAISAAVG